MLKQSFRSVVTTWLTGLLALLPLVLTLALLAWLFSLLNRLVGPSTVIGQLLGALGQPFASNPVLAYLVGTLVLLGSLYPLGLAVQLGLRRPLAWLLDMTLRRAPLIGSLYGLADRFVGLLDRSKNADIAAMSPVWCIFGGEGAAVLALCPNPETFELDGRSYCAILVPTAPIPVGGGLIYVPVEWLRPAEMGVEGLTSIYLSMGLTPPHQAGKLAKEQAVPTDGDKAS
ncbi:DUF502 domain-containing protein [Pseudomonas sp. JS3066]|jgi:uncharacterized membrane protein|uniref:DUF502 domain-containing protein n=1 Tax=unclassified Pseudomonas TaxID=196821 RepID=UPI000EA8FC2B|nr:MULTISPECIES: DUF502 domain-containing protein [unclassified Pseudomonas]AYF89553.1 DUF502 domain-containing protein [Pseudomonas sp. DY-1]MDH4656097.1 DUF502 domain-containing protein [Pseudomonas sp. BN606]MRK21294.1 DUF502 domain-containing protein [Pseudomonas sp. JG-B]WVK92892.1 DUF502 domain-containing protein [Pseudomonas sp. JS3066]